MPAKLRSDAALKRYFSHLMGDDAVHSAVVYLDCRELEKILEERKVGKKVEYLIKWEGYDKAEYNTWEPANEIRKTEAFKKWQPGGRTRRPRRGAAGEVSSSVVVFRLTT